MSVRKLAAISAVALLAAATGCTESDDPGAGPAGTDAQEPSAAVETRILKTGYGRAAEPGDLLTVHTTGWLYDEEAPDHRGTKFWSSLDDNRKLEFVLGEGRMIKGWDVGLPGMLIGEVRELTIPPELGYGAAGRGPIPPNSTLVFEVELFQAVSPGDARRNEP